MYYLFLHQIVSSSNGICKYAWQNAGAFDTMNAATNATRSLGIDQDCYQVIYQGETT